MMDMAAFDAISISTGDGLPLRSSDMNDEGTLDACMNVSRVDEGMEGDSRGPGESALSTNPGQY